MDSQTKDNLIKRSDLVTIASLIPENVRVLDLGCGDGALLSLLRKDKNVKGTGVEISQDNILECVHSGIPVIHEDLNQGLSDFSDQSYDFVILSQTLQAVKRPDTLLEEILRVGNKGIISFINFGYYKLRLQLLFKGKMPETKTLPHHWFDTPNIHLGTIKDFRKLCLRKNFSIVDEIPSTINQKMKIKLCPNFFAPMCVFVITKK